MILQRLISFLGIFFILGIAFLLSNNKRKINYRLVIWGLVLQMVFAFVILKTTPGKAVFSGARHFIVRILAFTDEGASFLFGNLYRSTADLAESLGKGQLTGHVMIVDSDAPDELVFGQTVTGTRDTLLVPITNPGTAPLIIQEVQLGESGEFKLISPALPATVPVKGAAQLLIEYAPENVGAISQVLTLKAAGIPEPVTVNLKTTAVETPAPDLQVTTEKLTGSQLKSLGTMFAFHVLPTIIFFAALMGVLYHLGIMQRVVQFMAWIMSKTMGASGVESLSAASNIFVGQTEAPLVIRPYVNDMTISELMAIMVGGFATIAGGVMAAYVRFGVDPGHLLAASVMSAPAALAIAKIIYPEVEEPKTKGSVKLNIPKNTSNVIDAAATGATDGLKLAVNVGAMLLAFISLIAILNYLLMNLDEIINFFTFGLTNFDWNITLKSIFGIVFAPFAFFMGVDFKDIFEVGNLLGSKIAINEFVAYLDLAALKGTISDRSFIITTYALCGFANFSSIAIQIGGISALAPGRRSDLAKIGLKAMIGGALASWLTATIAGILL